jgi:DNA repair photolyase
MSLKIIEKVNAAGIRVSTLSKGILPAELADATRFNRENEYGFSIISLDEDFRRRWEPGSAPYRDRIAAARYLHGQGCHTWTHMEPYPTPNVVQQEILPILEAISFVDHIDFGGWNYNPFVRKYKDREAFYQTQARIVTEFCQTHHITCSTF